MLYPPCAEATASATVLPLPACRCSRVTSLAVTSLDMSTWWPSATLRGIPWAPGMPPGPGRLGRALRWPGTGAEGGIGGEPFIIGASYLDGGRFFVKSLKRRGTWMVETMSMPSAGG